MPNIRHVYYQRLLSGPLILAASTCPVSFRRIPSANKRYDINSLNTIKWRNPLFHNALRTARPCRLASPRIISGFRILASDSSHINVDVPVETLLHVCNLTKNWFCLTVIYEKCIFAVWNVLKLLKKSKRLLTKWGLWYRPFYMALRRVVMLVPIQTSTFWC